jgi:hypothetical protein
VSDLPADKRNFPVKTSKKSSSKLDATELHEIAKDRYELTCIHLLLDDLMLLSGCICFFELIMWSAR